MRDSYTAVNQTLRDLRPGTLSLFLGDFLAVVTELHAEGTTYAATVEKASRYNAMLLVAASTHMQSSCVGKTLDVLTGWSCEA